MNVCFATSECVPFAKEGGLADVSGALPKALADLGCSVKVFLPLYERIRTLDHGLILAAELQSMPVQIGDRTVRFDTWYGHLPGSQAEVYFIDCPPYFHRPGLYTGDRDEPERFILLQQAVFKVLQRYHWAPDVLHCNDWATALLPVFLRETYGWDQLFTQTASLLTIHNIGYQGRFSDEARWKAGLSADGTYPGGPFELYGTFSFLKAGLVYADLISTVSPTYAQEIQHPSHGEGLDGVLRSRATDLVGILNGIDRTVWNPATDTLLPAPYDRDSLDKKAKNKQALLDKVGLPYRKDVPVVGVVSRLAGQKGFDLLQPVLEPLVQEHDVQFVVLGDGEARYEDFFRWAGATFPDRVGGYLGYDDALAHLIEGSADFLLMPSRYEPCGLNQMYSLAYGTIPIVRRTGGLADTVLDYHAHPDTGNGFSFDAFTPGALHTTILRALSVYHDATHWRALQRRAMAADFSWQQAARKYLDAYERALRNRRG